jgi:hypothetical protein
MKTMPSITSVLTRAVSLASLVALATLPTLRAQVFVNGDFENGTLSGWTQGSGAVTNPTTLINPADYVVGGARYDASYNQNSIVTGGLDANTATAANPLGSLNRVYGGVYSARVNDTVNDYSVSLLQQSVTNYGSSNIFFAWAAVLEDSHGPTDSDIFKLTLRDDTTGTLLYDVTFNSATAPAGLFTTSLVNAVTGFRQWYFTDWQVQNLAVTAGHDFTLSLIAADCPYGGHAGYVYLDGFGAVVPPSGPGPGAVPEPSTYGLIGAAALLGAVAFRRWKAKAAALA